MKKIKILPFLLLLFVFVYNTEAQTITFRGCTTNIGIQDYILSKTGTTNDGGTIRNTYEATPNDFAQGCPLGACEVRIIWNIGAARWEIQLDNDGPILNPDYTTAVLYFNTSASVPNPPDLTLGTWVDGFGGSCPIGEFTTMSGTGVQSTLGGCAAPTAQATGLGFGTVTANSIQLNSFTAPVGGATGYVIKVNTVNVFAAPVDGALPAANTVYGGGEQVVFAGTSNAGVTITSLAASTQHFFKVFAYNDCSGTNTFENTGTTANTTTLAALPSCISISPPVGTTNTWMGCADSDWSNGANWSTGVAPVATDVVYVPANANTPLLINEVATCQKMIVEIGGVCKIDYNAGGKLLVKFN